MAQPIATSQIARHAVRLLEQTDLANFFEGSEISIDLAEQYPEAMDILLSSCDWDFASRLVDLPLAQSAIADPDLPYAYVKPADCVRIIAVIPNDVEWRADADFIRADAEAPLRIRYTFRTDQEARLPSIFKDAVACHLAAMLAPKYLRTTSRTQLLAQQAERALAEARRALSRTASNRRYDGLPAQSDWVSVALR